MTDTGAVRSKLDIARVFRDTFAVIRRQAMLLLGVAIVAYTLPSLAGGAILRMYMRPLADAVQADPTAIFRSPLYWGTLAFGLAVAAFSVACLTWIAISDLEGRRPSAQESLKLGAAKSLPVFATMVLAAIGAWIGMLFLLVPGIILALMWAVAVPATVEETSNPIRALGRSRALTKGNRWRVLGLTLVTVIVLVIMYALLAGAMGGGAAYFSRNEPSLIVTAISSLLGLAQTIILGVGGAALYVQLREIKGGGESVARVFA